jgi:hypothetical protein
MVVIIVAGNRKSAARKGLMWYGIPQACKFFCKSVTCNNLLQTRVKGRKNSLKVSKTQISKLQKTASQG